MARSRKPKGATDKDVKDTAEPKDDVTSLQTEEVGTAAETAEAEPDKPAETASEPEVLDLKADEVPVEETRAETTESETPDPQDSPAETAEQWQAEDARDELRDEDQSPDDAKDGVKDEKFATSDDPVDDPLPDEASEEKTDAESESAPEVEKAAAVAPAEPQVKVVQGSMWPGVFGGVIAALVGFIVGRGDALDAYLPAALQRDSVDISAVEAQTADLATQAAALAAQSETLVAQAEAQTARLDALESATPVAAADPALAESVTALTAQIAELATRLAEVESRPVAPPVEAASNEAVEALQSELDAQKTELAELAARAQEAEAKAASEAARLLARAALTQVETAVETGQAFSPALADLEEVTPIEVPEVLREAAEAGVPTLAALQSSFPDAARAGLAAARAEVPEAEVDGLTGFLKRQLNVRSIEPKEGTDPDAVLSRAEAALEAGDLDTALAEMEALPEAARGAMTDWLEAATARKTAQDAAGALADSLNSN